MHTTPTFRSVRRGCAALLVVGQVLAPLSAAAQRPSRIDQPRAAAAATPKPQEHPRVHANRAVPRVVPRPARLEFSDAPTDAEFYDVRAFREPLVPLGPPSRPEENRALARALEAYEREGRPETARPVLEFLLRHPTTPWRPSLLANLADDYYAAGYFSRALRSWDDAWRQAKGDQTPKGRMLADAILGKWLEAMTHLGHVAPLKARLAEIADRDVTGPATVHIQLARESVWFLENRHHEAIASGPGALDRLLREEAADRSLYKSPHVLATFHAAPAGISLTELAQLGRSIGKPLQMAYRPAGAEVAVPSIVHFHVDHFAAIVAVKEDRYLLSDATLGDRWVSKAMLDSEASGYVLLPQPARLPSDWRPVLAHEGQSVYGKCRARISSPTDDPGPAREPAAPGKPCVTGMARYSFNPTYGTVRLFDTPVGYGPPVGPAIPIEVSYNEYDTTSAFTWHGHFGAKWTFNWLAYISEEGWGVNNYAPWYVSVYMRGGGKEHYRDTSQGLLSTSGSSRARLYKMPGNPIRYERHLSDGTVEVYAQSDGGPTNRRKVLLTEVIDPAGQRVLLTYDSMLRIVALSDALDQVTTFTYDDPVDSRRITKVTDPFGRLAHFKAAGNRLVSITDTIGMVSSFAYAANDAIRTLTTPYGTTTFRREFVDGAYILEVTDAMGATERLETHDLAADLPAVAPALQVPTGFSSHNVDMNRHVSVYWDKRAWALYPGDKSKAVITKWLLKPAEVEFSHDIPTKVSIPASIKRPLENRVWFAYQGQTDPLATGFREAPSKVARVLDDGTTQLRQMTYNNAGRVTSITDPLGRQISFGYAANLLDLLEVRQTTGEASEVLATFGDYTSGHAPREIIDAAGQQTTVTYNASGQVQTVTNAKNELTTLSYTDGYLTGVSGPLGSSLSYTYDDYGRVRTATDVDGYATTYDYDLFDRPTRITYPDGSFEQLTWTRLNLTELRDRRGQVTRHFYDQLGRVTSVRDGAGRTVSLAWCKCGSLDSLTDAKGQKTTWERDAQNRVTRELRADGTTATVYAYEEATSRLKQVTDPKLQITSYTYALDDALSDIEYTNAAIPTPSVTYTYDATYPRLATIVDGTGTTTLTYHPVGSPGAGQLASVDGPLPNDVITYAYDQLGHVTSRAIDNVGLAITYDPLGRVTQEANALGAFAYSYVGTTTRLASIDYPNGQTSTYSYRPNLEDRRLETIHHRRPGGATLSRFEFTYDADGRIVTKTEQADSDAPTRWRYEYDRAHQLIGAVHETTGGAPSPLVRYAYEYDPAGNRTSEQIDDSVVTATHDALNRLDAHVAGGALRVAGTTNEAATVRVQSQPMATEADRSFSGAATVATGTNMLTVSATDASGNTSTRVYEVDITGAGRTFVYDANGNLSSDGVRTFEWNANDQLTALVLGATRMEYAYNGMGYRVLAREISGGIVVSERRFVVADGGVEEERNAGGAQVVARHFREGSVVEGVQVRFLTRDFLGSATTATDAAGDILVRYQYDPFGRSSRIEGEQDIESGFTGHWHDRATGVVWAPFRAYDPALGRWLSSDPIGLQGGINLYAYTTNNPTNLIDPLGLFSAAAYASCLEKYRNPITEQLPKALFDSEGEPMPSERCAEGESEIWDWLAPSAHVGNAAMNRYAGDTGRSGINTKRHPTTWQHKLGGRLGPTGSRVGRFAGRFSVALTVFEGFYDLGLLPGCAIEQFVP